MTTRKKYVEWQPVPPVNDSRKLAYFFYATDDGQVCNALIAGKKLRELGTPSSIHIVTMVTEDVSNITRHVMEANGIIPMTVDRWRRKMGTDQYKDSLTKLLIFRKLGYDRLICIDTDTVIQRNLDHLFYLPRAFITSVLLVVDPDEDLFKHLEHAIKVETEVQYDMDVLNNEWKSLCGILPLEYVVLTTHLQEDMKRGNRDIIQELPPQSQRVLIATDPLLEIIDPCTEYVKNRVFDMDTAMSFRNFFLKPLAVHHTRLLDVIVIDTDCILLDNPAKLWQVDVYTTTGTVFFYDRVIQGVHT
ncbi:hypothetical protein THRCLA_04047 [Thraustotheca clavata]|uniref:Uncharacterized protein n=1 Tax=Thraustotheca clavata TaxID=74557 RepID=A0A1W0A017_9STRA|nr:hypothetical protein THRCLA_04047 [Thraustotheca clavata]